MAASGAKRSLAKTLPLIEVEGSGAGATTGAMPVVDDSSSICSACIDDLRANVHSATKPHSADNGSPDSVQLVPSKTAILSVLKAA
jgi:hypothetical protein